MWILIALNMYWCMCIPSTRYYYYLIEECLPSNCDVDPSRWYVSLFYSTEATTSNCSQEDSLEMSGSGKSLLGLWLYRTGEEWTLKEGEHEVSIIIRHPAWALSSLNEKHWLQMSILQKFTFNDKIPLGAALDSRNSVIFSLKNQVGGLARALQVFQVRSTGANG